VSINLPWGCSAVSVLPVSDHKLNLVAPEELSRQSAIIHAPPKGKLAFDGDGPDRLLCGDCAEPLAAGVRGGELVGVYVECPKCGAVNDANS
jgi:hypothetical protein